MIAPRRQRFWFGVTAISPLHIGSTRPATMAL
jgi:hypothetical protein